MSSEHERQADAEVKEEAVARVKEGLAEVGQKTMEMGKKMGIRPEDKGSTLLTLSLLIHAVLGLLFGAVFLVVPQRMVSMDRLLKMGGPMVRMSSIHALGHGIIALGGMFYDTRHKWMLNAALAMTHILSLLDLLVLNRFFPVTAGMSGFKDMVKEMVVETRVAPHMSHMMLDVGMLALHSMALYVGRQAAPPMRMKQD